MKRLSIAITCIMVINFSYSQVVTSVDDYNYVTMGFIADKRLGREIQPGYSLEEVTKQETFTDAFGGKKDMQFLYYKKGVEKRAILLVIANPEKQAFFLCIPTLTASQEIWKSAFKEIDILADEWKSAIIWGLMKAISYKLL